MRTFIAALLGATAYLPALVHATSVLSNPADAAASVPAVEAPSTLADYRPYREQQSPGWQTLNRAVANPSGNAGMNHGSMHSGAAETGSGDHAAHREEAAK